MREDNQVSIEQKNAADAGRASPDADSVAILQQFGFPQTHVFSRIIMYQYVSSIV